MRSQSLRGADAGAGWVGAVTVRVITGDCREALRTLPDESVHCVVTSPPYYSQRDYGHDAQIGLEGHPREYVAELVAVFREARRVLRADGTLWLNLGDSYYSGNGQPVGDDKKSPNRNWSRRRVRPLDKSGMGFPKKCLLGVPWRVALAMIDDGWTLRQEIIWHREGAFFDANVEDRPHRMHETIFQFARGRTYTYAKTDDDKSVWTFGQERSFLEHVAPFPTELVERCITRGCPAGGCVLDPFGGGGTTGLVADRLGRDAILIELNEAYSEMARRRIGADAPLFAKVAAE